MGIKENLHNYIRILKISKKADKDEFLDTLRICAIGISVVGAIGFIFYIVSFLVGGL